MGVQPGNPVVGGINLRIPAIQSPNYVAGVSGWHIDINGSAEFNNLTIRGTFSGTNFIIDSAGIFFYNGTPALGNLILSLAAVAGTDTFGNTYPQGLNATVAPSNMPAMTNGWSIGGHATYKLDLIGNLVVSWKDLNVGTSTDGTTIWANGSLPAAYRPPNTRRIVCYTDENRIGVGPNPGSAALEIQSDGSVQCFGVGAAATRVDLFAVIPISF